MSAGKKERWALRQFGVGRRRRPGRIGRGWGRVSGDAALTRSLRLLCLNASSALGSADMMMGARACALTVPSRSLTDCLRKARRRHPLISKP